MNFFSEPLEVTIEKQNDSTLVKFQYLDDILIRPFNLETDTPIIAEWVNMDYAELWGMRGLSLEAVRKIYEKEQNLEGHNAYIGEFNSTQERVFLLHVYEPIKDSINSYHKFNVSDRGFHCLLAPVKRKIPNLTICLFRAMNEFIFSDPKVLRSIADPDIYNEKFFIATKRSGYQYGPVIKLPHKITQLVFLTRERFEEFKSKPPVKKMELKSRALWVWFRILPIRIKEKVQRLLCKS